MSKHLLKTSYNVNYINFVRARSSAASPDNHEKNSNAPKEGKFATAKTNQLIGDVKKNTKNSFNNMINEISNSSASKQLVIGSISGWCTGFLTVRVGKVVAVSVGGSIILFQLAHHQGYIKMNWDDVQKSIKDKTGGALDTTGGASKIMDNIKEFAKGNRAFAAGFLGGFLLGIAS